MVLEVRRQYKRSFERVESVPDGTRKYKMVRQRILDEWLTRAYKRIRDTMIQYEMVCMRWLWQGFKSVQHGTRWYGRVTTGLREGKRAQIQSISQNMLFFVRFSKIFFCWKALSPTNLLCTQIWAWPIWAFSYSSIKNKLDIVLDFWWMAYETVQEDKRHYDTVWDGTYEMVMTGLQECTT